ncbi:hypothetical protein [Actinoplanes sp. NPDC026670]|uniref:hypothetical protein n=1 Tax=Actinoplanes sp. NPDC026670 TaxID=3154700 RepID=UPI0033DD009F
MADSSVISGGGAVSAVPPGGAVSRRSPACMVWNRASAVSATAAALDTTMLLDAETRHAMRSGNAAHLIRRHAHR